MMDFLKTDYRRFFSATILTILLSQLKGPVCIKMYDSSQVPIAYSLLFTLTHCYFLPAK